MENFKSKFCEYILCIKSSKGEFFKIELNISDTFMNKDGKRLFDASVTAIDRLKQPENVCFWSLKRFWQHLLAIVAYLDDLIIRSAAEEQHRNN